MGAVPLIQGSHALPNRLLHQQIVHSSQSGLPNGGQNGTMHPQGGHRMQDGIVHQHQAGHPPQNGMGMGPQQTANSACSGGGFSHQQLGQGGSMGIPQQQMRLPSPLRELQVSSPSSKDQCLMRHKFSISTDSKQLSFMSSGLFHREFILYDFPLVVFYTISIIYLHLWYMLEGSVNLNEEQAVLIHRGPSSFYHLLAFQK